MRAFLYACLTIFAWSCSTVRLTPSAVRYLESGGGNVVEAEKAYEVAADAYDEARAWVPRRILGKVVSNPSTVEQLLRHAPMIQVDADDETELLALDTDAATRLRLLVDGVGSGESAVLKLARRARGLHDVGAITIDGLTPDDVVGTKASLKILRRNAHAALLDYEMVLAVNRGVYEYFVEGSLYFSIEPAIAIRPQLEAVAIPSIGINWRPVSVGAGTFYGESGFSTFGAGMSAASLQLLLGGALNPSDGGGEGSSGAIGVGISYPVAGIGALSVGAIWFGDSGEARGAPYISLTLGDFARSTSSVAPRRVPNSGQ